MTGLLDVKSHVYIGGIWAQVQARFPCQVFLTGVAPRRLETQVSRGDPRSPLESLGAGGRRGICATQQC